MFKHKYLDHNIHNLMNTINYVSSQWKEGFTFAGFIPLVDDYFGVTVDGFVTQQFTYQQNLLDVFYRIVKIKNVSVLKVGNLGLH